MRKTTIGRIHLKSKLIDRPEVRSVLAYKTAIEEMVDRLKVVSGVRSIYQIGSVSNPGISDIDMLVVFEDEAKVEIDPVRDFQCDQYLFTHQLYAVPEKAWSELRSLTFFHNYKLIFGREMPEIRDTLSVEEELELKRQIALEFLVKMHNVLTVQLRYKIIKLRSFLLEGKALIYDLEFLGISSGPLHEAVKQIIDWRASWFDCAPSDSEIERLIVNLYQELEALLEVEFKSPMYLPSVANQQLSKNMVLRNGKFSDSTSGVVIPDLGILPAKKHFNLLHHLNSFQFFIPIVRPEPNSKNMQRFAFLRELRSYNQSHLPGFLIPGSSLKVI